MGGEEEVWATGGITMVVAVVIATTTTTTTTITAVATTTTITAVATVGQWEVDHHPSNHTALVPQAVAVVLVQQAVAVVVAVAWVAHLDDITVWGDFPGEGNCLRIGCPHVWNV